MWWEWLLVLAVLVAFTAFWVWAVVRGKVGT
jgi:hypothetical protein